LYRLESPNHTYTETIETCCLGIVGNNDLRNRINTYLELLQNTSANYSDAASKGLLYQIQAFTNAHGPNPQVLGELTKSDFLTLYNTYFVNNDKPGRKIYSALMASANEKCPFCGGIGRPRNLDHYLPKAHYPQFSILPINLVPSCRDCNMDGKGSFIATSESEQVLHPYLDHHRFFNEQWLYAQYVIDETGEPGIIEYFVQAPEHWEDEQKSRVQKHFNDFDLALRFSKEASSRLVIYLEQIKKLTNTSITLNDAKTIILQSAIDSSPFINHWERVMCITLMGTLA
jgi:hypothetical protein